MNALLLQYWTGSQIVQSSDTQTTRQGSLGNATQSKPKLANARTDFGYRMYVCMEEKSEV
jgi:hypothetical protein